MKNCGPMRSPLEPFFDLQFSMSDPIFGMGMECKPGSFKQRLSSRPMMIDVVEVRYVGCAVLLVVFVTAMTT